MKAVNLGAGATTISNRSPSGPANSLLPQLSIAPSSRRDIGTYAWLPCVIAGRAPSPLLGHTGEVMRPWKFALLVACFAVVGYWLGQGVALPLFMITLLLGLYVIGLRRVGVTPPPKRTDTVWSELRGVARATPTFWNAVWIATPIVAIALAVFGVVPWVNALMVPPLIISGWFAIARNRRRMSN